VFRFARPRAGFTFALYPVRFCHARTLHDGLQNFCAQRFRRNSLPQFLHTPCPIPILVIILPFYRSGCGISRIIAAALWRDPRRETGPSNLLGANELAGRGLRLSPAYAGFLPQERVIVVKGPERRVGGERVDRVRCRAKLRVGVGLRMGTSR